MKLKRLPQPAKFVLHELELLLKQAEQQFPAKVNAGQMSDTTANVRYSRIADAVEFFRVLIGNDDRVQDDHEIEDPDQPLPLYTNIDKFHHLVKENPVLQQLAERLGLELE